MLEKYLNLEGFLEKSLKIKSALKNTGKSLTGLEKSLNSTIFYRTYDVPRRYFFCGSFMFLFCLVFAMSLCASVYMCFVVTCWERADLLALVCGV